MINYPNVKNISKKTNQNKEINIGNRGMDFEQKINTTNEYYVAHDIAYIYKKPTPIKIVRVVKSNNFFEQKHKIVEAYFEKKSTTDYNGIYRGKYIDFEAKQTKYSVFNIRANLHKHQIDHLKNTYNHGGISFLLVNFSKYNKIFLLEIKKIEDFLLYNKNKSQIPIQYFEENGYLVEEKMNPPIDYLEILKILIKE